ncbi:proline dehydrogenase [Blastococcus colisei]|uniref:Proline dehydrogenase n=1 Tax=Blastococcus colisei TaxID=1564162 RepID=A0A543PAZ6_9ACTN|nr:hypothetical protein [Blastococcus colisei]TQN41251.1 proline dehydrogenase [Blastococcus colisei]
MITRVGTALQHLLRRAAASGRDPVELAREVVAAGCLVELESDDVALVERLGGAGLSASVEVTVPVDRFGPAPRAAALAAAAGLSVALTGPAEAVERVDLAGARVVVAADEPGAEDRCRALAGRRVRLVARRRRGSADLSFVRCLNVLLAGEGHPGIAVSDPRLIAIAGERAAWNGRTPDSWELVMPYGELVSERRRLVAAGSVVRVSVRGRS